jgi:hypothetical protein
VQTTLDYRTIRVLAVSAGTSYKQLCTLLNFGWADAPGGGADALDGASVRRVWPGAPDGATLRRDNGHGAPDGVALRHDGLGAPKAAAWSHGGLNGLTATAPTRGAWQGLFVASASVWSMAEQDQRAADSRLFRGGSFSPDVGKCDVDNFVS